MTRRICIYHGNCADGFTAAWIVNKALGVNEWMSEYEKLGVSELTFHAGFYKDPPPDVSGAIVYIVDFSYKRQIMEEIVSKANKVIHIDHHASAIEDMVGYVNSKFVSFYSPENTESGAMLAWKYFFPSRPVPRFIEHIDDRDRWKFLLPGTREVSANVFSYEYTFENWDKLMCMSVEEQIKDGTAIERSNMKNIKELMGVVVRRMNIAGYNVPVANIPYQFGSDMCMLLAKDEPFAAYYYDKPTHREFGLRSASGSVNVAKIAESFGGGGHENASGFRRTFDEARKFDI
jgi:oligoribonuclease NrnB/cAMP/cGMP phosphodiesterase (DHH superfamily)